MELFGLPTEKNPPKEHLFSLILIFNAQFSPISHEIEFHGTP